MATASAMTTMTIVATASYGHHKKKRFDLFDIFD